MEYLPQKVTSSDFDFQVTSVDEVFSAKIAHEAANTFESIIKSNQLASRRKSDSNSNEKFSSTPNSSPLSNYSRRHSDTPSSSSNVHSISSINSTSLLKPLLLRPAPGPTSSIVLKLSISDSTNSDLLLRVVESQTPIATTNPNPLPIPIVAPIPVSKSAVTFNPVSIIPLRPQRPCPLHLTIPSSSPPLNTPPLISSFSTESKTSSSSLPSSPESDYGYHPANNSPLCKFPHRKIDTNISRLERSDTIGTMNSFDYGFEKETNPIWIEVGELLKERKRRSQVYSKEGI